MVSDSDAAPSQDERLIRRLEAFSDIVIGFCLAELGLALRIPDSIREFSNAWPAIQGFGISFGLVALVWFLHNRLFAKYFVTKNYMVVLNFVMLCALIVMIYFFETMRHFAALGIDATLPTRYWYGSFGVVYLLIGAMYAIGCVVKRRTLEHQDLMKGARRAAIVTLCGAGGVVFATSAGHISGSIERIVLAYFAAVVFISRFGVPAILRLQRARAQSIKPARRV